jgi:hypothetical protein
MDGEFNKESFIKEPFGSDHSPCDICKKIRASYYDDENSICEEGDTFCLDKDKAMIKLLYELLQNTPQSG